MFIVWQEVEANGGILEIEKFDLLSRILETFRICQLPILQKIQTSHANKTFGEAESRKASPPWSKGVASRVVSILSFRQKSPPIPITILQPNKVFPIQPQLRFRPLLSPKQRVKKNIPQDLNFFLRSLYCHMMNNVPTRTVPCQVDMNLRLPPTLQPRSRLHPLQCCPPIIVGARIPVLRRSPVVHGHHSSLANADKVPAEGIVDSTVCRGMREASPVKEYDHRNNFRGAQRSLKVSDTPLSLVPRGWQIHPVKQPNVSIDMID